MTKRIIVILDDPDVTTSEHYSDLLAEELQSMLANRFQLISLEIKNGDPEKSPKEENR